MKKTPVVAGASLSLYSIIAGEVELMGQANLLDWRGDLRFRGLTRVGRARSVEQIAGGCICGTMKNKKGFADNAVGIKHRNLRDRVLAFEHYGGSKCACCLETEFSFLSLDHKDGEGNTHRKELLGNKFSGGHHMYRKLRELSFPDGFQVLCMNCQGRRDNGGICPHKRKALTGPELLKEFERLRVGSGNTEAMRSEEYRSALANIMRKATIAKALG